MQDLDEQSRTIEEKTQQLRQKMEQMKSAREKQKGTKLLRQISKMVSIEEETTQQDLRKLSFYMGDDEVV